MFDLLKQRNFVLIWIASLISIAGDYALTVAIPIAIYRLTGSTLATAGAFAASFIPRVLVGSVAGVFVDRWDRKLTMVWSDLIRAALLIPLFFASSADRIWLIYLVSAIQGTVGLFFSPAERALLPRLVGEDHLVAANSLNSIGDEIGRLGGPALGAALFAFLGLSGVAIVDAATFIASAVLIGRIVADTKPDAGAVIEAGSAAWRRMQHEWREGLSIVRRSPDLRVIFVSSALSNVSEGVFLSLALAPLVLHILGGTDAQVGWFASSQAIGGLIAGLTIARRAKRFDKRTLFIAGGIGLSITDLCVFNSGRFVEKGNQAVGLALFFMFLAGFPAVAKGIGSSSLLQSLSEDIYRGRVFGALGAVNSVAVLIGLGVAGALGNIIGIVPVLTAGALMGLAGGIASLSLRANAEPVPATTTRE